MVASPLLLPTASDPQPLKTHIHRPQHTGRLPHTITRFRTTHRKNRRRRNPQDRGECRSRTPHPTTTNEQTDRRKAPYWPPTASLDKRMQTPALDPKPQPAVRLLQSAVVVSAFHRPGPFTPALPHGLTSRSRLPSRRYRSLSFVRKSLFACSPQRVPRLLQRLRRDTADAAGQVHVLDHDGYPLRVHRTQLPAAPHRPTRAHTCIHTHRIAPGESPRE